MGFPDIVPNCRKIFILSYDVVLGSVAENISENNTRYWLIEFHLCWVIYKYVF